MHWSEVWHGKSPSAHLLRAILTPPSWLYAAGWNAYLLTYRMGLKKPQAPHHPIICVGNLVAGGVGKTPLALHVADVLESLGRNVVIGCSGYGSPASEAASVAPSGELAATDWGDEPAMIRMLRPDIPLIVGRRRVFAAQLCHRHFPDAVLLMDDGFQHLPLAKDVTILVDPDSGNTNCLPAGPYREPRSHRKRADLVLPGQFQVASNGAGFVRSHDGLVAPALGQVNVLCALGSPEKFLESLKSQGLEIQSRKLLPDHDKLDAGNLFEGFAAETPLVVTAKDWVKLRSRQDLTNRTIWIAQLDVRIEPASDFKQWLQQKLHEIQLEIP